MLNNVSPVFEPDSFSAEFCMELIKRENTPASMEYFVEHCDKLDDYGYWFLLSTVWVSYSGWIELDVWKKHFASDRRHRRLAIMKPDELQVFKKLPNYLEVYRAHRENETDWISFTLNPETAAKMALQRGVNKITLYKINKKYCIAFFLRRGEDELITLQKDKANYIREYTIKGGVT